MSFSSLVVFLFFLSVFNFSCTTLQDVEMENTKNDMTVDSSNAEKINYKQLIRSDIRKNKRSIRQCFEHHLAKKSEKKGGKLVLAWNIVPPGLAKNIQVRKSYALSLDDCISKEIEKMQFSPPPGGRVVSVVFPFAFYTNGKEIAK